MLYHFDYFIYYSNTYATTNSSFYYTLEKIFFVYYIRAKTLHSIRHMKHIFSYYIRDFCSNIIRQKYLSTIKHTKHTFFPYYIREKTLISISKWLKDNTLIFICYSNNYFIYFSNNYFFYFSNIYYIYY